MVVKRYKPGNVFLCEDGHIRAIMSVRNSVLLFTHKDTLYKECWLHPRSIGDRAVEANQLIGQLPVVPKLTKPIRIPLKQN